MIKVTRKIDDKLMDFFVYYGKDVIEHTMDYDAARNSAFVQDFVNLMNTIPLENCKKILVTHEFFRYALASIDMFYLDIPKTYKGIPIIFVENLTDPYLDKQ